MHVAARLVSCEANHLTVLHSMGLTRENVMVANIQRVVARAHVGQQKCSPIWVCFQLPMRAGYEGGKLRLLSCCHQGFELILVQAAKHHWHLGYMNVPHRTPKVCELSSRQTFYVSASEHPGSPRSARRTLQIWGTFALRFLLICLPNDPAWRW
eukprot:Skav235939  [mRNA]  locus=scaffold4666:12847:15090:+ [translate_table: standard]